MPISRKPAIVFCALLGAMAIAESDAQSPPSEANQDFATVKAEHLKRLQAEVACVEAATDFESMHACMPRPPGGHWGPPPGEPPH
jgi:hypothetical protein